jgi:23S rRNA (cytosine1962-C5)-methyltransferase
MDATASPIDATPFANRLRKNARHLFRWAQQRGLTAFRLYDRDIPEFPYVVEWFDGRVHLVEFPRRKSLRSGSLEAERAAALQAACDVLEVAPDRVVTKTHLPHAWGRSQYEATGQAGQPFVVKEGPLSLEVELAGHLDTGLYMDHRRTRERVRGEARGKDVLNLFAYTGSFTVAAALGGAASTTTVDLSATYLAWAERNLALNGFRVGPTHRLIRDDVLQWLEEAAAAGPAYDLVILDPPPFSTSKRMQRDFNVQRDHPRLLQTTLALLRPGGVLYFSTNFQGFRLQEETLRGVEFEELTPGSLPEDFARKDSHRLWRITGAVEAAEPAGNPGSRARPAPRRSRSGAP